MRSALTVLGVVIGITSIVGMTSLIRGFDQSLRDSISQLGPNTIIVQKFGALSLIGGGKSFLEVARRPNLTMDDAQRDRARLPVGRARRRVARRDRAVSQSRIYYGHERTQQLAIIGATENWSRGQLRQGRVRARCSSPAEVEHRRPVVAARQHPVDSRSFPNVDPIGKTVRIGCDAVHGHRRARPAAEPGRISRRRRRLRDHSRTARTRSSSARC